MLRGSSETYQAITQIFVRFLLDAEFTQYLEKRDGTFEQVLNLICAKQLCCKCEAVEDVNVDLNSVESVSTHSDKTP